MVLGEGYQGQGHYQKWGPVNFTNVKVLREGHQEQG